MRTTAFIVLLVIAPTLARADEPAVVPVKAGASAPYTGLLVPELRMGELLEAEVQAASLGLQLKLAGKHAVALEELYKKQLDKALQPNPWWSDPRLVAGIGFATGVAVAVLSVWAGTKIVEASNRGP